MRLKCESLSVPAQLPLRLWLTLSTIITNKRLYSALPLGNKVLSTMTQYATQSHYPGTELSTPGSVLLMLSAKLGSDKCQFCTSMLWLGLESNYRSPSHTGGLRFSHSITASSRWWDQFPRINKANWRQLILVASSFGVQLYWDRATIGFSAVSWKYDWLSWLGYSIHNKGQHCNVADMIDCHVSVCHIGVMEDSLSRWIVHLRHLRWNIHVMFVLFVCYCFAP